jgi:NAD(P)H-hydrate epimerase
MQQITKDIFKNLYRPAVDSHKGQNGKLTIIGGSKLFHGASLWSLKVASRIVDMVFYSTVLENEILTQKLKAEVYDFICVPRIKIQEYIDQSDAVLIGPGLVRGDTGTGESGEETKKLTETLLKKFPEKKWIIDAGSLQVMNPEWLKSLKQAVITPHQGEFKMLFGIDPTQDLVSQKAKKYGCTIVLKGQQDIICSPSQCAYDSQGNPGMTKGGTGDVLAGLIAALACKNDLFLASCAGVFTQGLVANHLFTKVGPYFNASDVCAEIPVTLKELMGY